MRAPRSLKDGQVRGVHEARCEEGEGETAPPAKAEKEQRECRAKGCHQGWRSASASPPQAKAEMEENVQGPRLMPRR